jgi:hypothetical protein
MPSDFNESIESVTKDTNEMIFLSKKYPKKLPYWSI